MVSIIISDLYLSREQQPLGEITADEMKTIAGGARRRRRGSNTINAEDLPSIIKSIDNQVGQMTINLNETSENLRKQLGI
ncbi:hypothetical protein [Cylindrospermum sp. FACHB-282]|uniref:hypothetical protein n=1 Tax=Cylindrospermum sp. FACHB-282 TaxID=2692794 RepID=UPI00168606A5|nr:hypothetical protein [Cylindrospermum sp. FACHB-282]MBD2385178.1 hypothetical protein [Cylindrospermum sp. FACHB-282]